MTGSHFTVTFAAALFHLVLALRAWRNGRKGEAISHFVKMIYHLTTLLSSSGP
jgi:hypothetical protein